MLGLAVWGVVSFQNLPIDAYPDLSPPHVEIVTQWPGHAAEEVERLITIPLEIEMNGIPKLDALRSISLYGLSSITMNFEYDTDPYFAREQAFERIANAHGAAGRDAGHVAAVQPERPDLPLRAAEPGPLAAGAEDPRGLGARAAATARSRASPTTPASAARPCSTRCCSIRNKLFVVRRHRAADRRSSSRSNNANAGGGFYSQGGQFYYVRGLGLVEDHSRTSATSSSRRTTAFRSTSRTSRTVAIGHAPRLGQFGYMKQDDAVEGVILMRVGEQAQVVLKKVEEMTDDAEPARAAAGREDRAVLRPHRPDRGDDADRRAQPGARHAAGAGRSSASVPLQRAHGADRRGHDSVRAAVLVHLPRLGAHSRPTCCRSAPSISASSSTARWSWWRTSSASWPRGTASSTT